MKIIDRLRWRIANLIDRIPGQCWADLADWPLGNRRLPWAPQRPGCREDMERCGSCYCGKLLRPEALLPIHAGPGLSPCCWVNPGQVHTLSCDTVTPEQVRAYLAAQAVAR
jgi:hypothetical protein